MKRFVGDALIAAFIIAAAAALAICFFAGSAALCEADDLQLSVLVKDRHDSVSLSDDSVFVIESNGFEMTVVVRDVSVYVEKCDCPDQVCVHTKAISSAYQSIICAPAGIILKIEPKGEGDEIIVAG